jgi:Tfp pilus assembly protein PilO
MKKFLIIFLVIQLFFILITGDIFWLKRQLKYQYHYRVEEEKKNDKLNIKLNKCLCFAPEKQPPGYCQKEEIKEYFYERKIKILFRGL